MSLATLNTFSIYWIFLALILVPIQLKIIAPYGRHASNKWGLIIDNKLGWVLMEIISPLVLLYFLLSNVNLIPRAVAHHQWYQQNFVNYPIKRKAVLPFLL